MIAFERFVLEWFVDYLNDCDLYCWVVGIVDGCVDFDSDWETDDNLHLRHSFIE